MSSFAGERAGGEGRPPECLERMLIAVGGRAEERIGARDLSANIKSTSYKRCRKMSLGLSAQPDLPLGVELIERFAIDPKVIGGASITAAR